MPREMLPYRSAGAGTVDQSAFAAIGDNVIFEPGVLVFHSENIRLGRNIYVGHQAILRGYHRNVMEIGDNTWIGPQAFIHSAGGITIGRNVGIGPGVKMISSYHEEEGTGVPILHSRLVFAAVTIGDDCDIGVGAIVLPGVSLGKGVQVGAGAVVTTNVPDYAVVAGVPAKVLRIRTTEAMQ